MKKIAILIIMSISILGYAHDSKEASFVIERADNQIEVNAEFPWTIRNALLKSNPDLQNTTDQIAFDQAFFNYVNSNFKLINKKGSLKLLEVKENKHEDGHTHQTNYTFVFSNGKVDKVSNSLMFNLNPTQKNHITVTLDEGTHTFTTTPKNPTHNMEVTIRESTHWALFFTIMFIGILLVFIKKIKNKKRRSNQLSTN